MQFQLNYRSGKAVYLQLVDQVRRAASSGLLLPGTPLPGIRPLAEQLRVNRNTVARAYSELEREGIVESVAGKGCFVRAVSSPYRKDVRRRLVGEALEDAVAHAHQLQIDREDFLALARERYDQFAQQRARASR